MFPLHPLTAVTGTVFNVLCLLPSATRLPTPGSLAPPQIRRSGPQVPARGGPARPQLTAPHPPGIGPHLRPDPDGARTPSGLVKDNASSRPSLRPRPLSSPALVFCTGNSPKGDQVVLKEKERATKVEYVAPTLRQQLYSSPPTRLRHRRESVGGGTVAPVANRGRQSSRVVPAPQSSFYQSEGE